MTVKARRDFENSNSQWRARHLRVLRRGVRGLPDDIGRLFRSWLVDCPFVYFYFYMWGSLACFRAWRSAVFTTGV